jgi:hypothetical protein
MSRLASAVTVSGLLRLTEQQGGFGAVLKKGDEQAGAIILVIVERGRTLRVLERVMQGDGRYRWSESLKGAPNAAEVDLFLKKRSRIDLDSWLIELDVASAERFTAEMSAID